MSGPTVWNEKYHCYDGSEYFSYELKRLKDLRQALADGADPNDADPLLVAVSKGSTSQMKSLLKAGARTDSRTEDGESPLYLAVAHSDRDKVEALLKAGADVNAAIPVSFARVVDDEEEILTPKEPGQTAAMKAARNGDLDLLTLLRRHGAAVDGVLHAAVIGDMEDGWRKECWNGGARESGPRVPQLLSDGMDPNATHQATFLAFDIGGRRGVSIDGNGSAPLHLAVRADFALESIVALVSAGANPNMADANGDTPLHLTNVPAVAQRLLDAGGDPSIKNKAGEDARQRMLYRGEYGADVAALYSRHMLSDVARDSNTSCPDLASVEECLAQKVRGLRM